MEAHLINKVPPPPSLGRQLLEFFGSLRLAMSLLAILIGACVVGTVVESRLDTAVAQTYVYDAPWFIAWLLMLCVNLICSAWVRYPWEKRLTGFVITHAGIVTILVGAIIGRVWGVEGHITLSKGEKPANFIVLPEHLIEVRTSQMKESWFKAVPLNVGVPTEKRRVQLQAGDAKVSVLGYAEELGIKTFVEEGGKDGKPAVQFVMQSAMVKEPIEQWLCLDDPERNRADLGPAVIRFERKTDSKPVRSSSPEFCREVHFVFAKIPEMSMVRSVEGASTGARAGYQMDPGASGAGLRGRLRLDVGDLAFDFPVAEVMGKTVPLKGTALKLKVLKYLPDFRMQGKEAVSVSEEPKNPALMFELSGKPPEGALLLARGPHGTVQDPAPISGKNSLTIRLAQDGKLDYTAVSKTKGITMGELQQGREVALGWADWRFTVARHVQNALIREELAPLSEGPYRPAGAAGIKVRVEKDDKSLTRWIAMASPEHFEVGGESVHVLFGQRLHPLGFTIGLEEFEVTRDEGTQNPAGFRSRVRFSGAGAAEEMEREISMNRPASFPEGLLSSLMGTSYKFSQASWNPNDLNQTTLQVLRDPGWSLKWIGSLMLCGGLVTMFYIVPYSRAKEGKVS